MPEIEWIKISTGLFDNEKIKLIRKLPDADTIIIIWLNLLILAGKVNDGGLVYLGDHIAYNAEELATVVDRPVNTVRLALATFKKYQMVEELDNGLFITNWEKHQSIEGMDKIRLQTRERTRLYRQRLSTDTNSQLQLIAGSKIDSGDVTVTSHASPEQTRQDKNRLEQNRTEQELLLSTVQNKLNDVLLFYENNVEKLTNGKKELILEACEKYTDIWVTDAILEVMAKKNVAHTWEYISGILKNWERDGHKVKNVSEQATEAPEPAGMLNSNVSIQRALDIVEGRTESTRLVKMNLERELKLKGIPFNSQEDL